MAERAYPNFLIARLAADQLFVTGYGYEPTAGYQPLDLPSTVDEAFEQYLERFGENRKLVRDLLFPLACAEGEGLPWGELWAAVASAMPGAARAYTKADIEWLMENGSSFILEAIEDDRSVYRLYHQALADYLKRSGPPQGEAQRAFTKALIATAPVTESGPDWISAHPYIRKHLAEHAVGGGMLGE